MPGIGVVKIYFQPGADIRTATAQVTSVSQTVLRQLPPGVTPPLILNFRARPMPIPQFALSRVGLSEGKLFDTAVNQIRPGLVTAGARGSRTHRAGNSARCTSTSNRRRCNRRVCLR